MDDCVFCSIVDGEVPSHEVYEDEATYAFLDANPLVSGHTLVIPKAHHERVNDMPAAVAGAVGRTIATVAPAAEAAVDATASTIAYNNGEAAGQEVPHVHAHIVPRSPDDGGQPVHALFGGPGEANDGELAAVAEDVAGRL
ncbi:MAG: histidine triad (HIT) family protein [Natronomonas sp.]|jgi:histidine triad (HIT) family protein